MPQRYRTDIWRDVRGEVEDMRSTDQSVTDEWILASVYILRYTDDSGDEDIVSYGRVLGINRTVDGVRIISYIVNIPSALPRKWKP